MEEKVMCKLYVQDGGKANRTKKRRNHGSFEFRDLFEIVNNLIYNNQVNSTFVTLCAALFFAGAVAKSAHMHIFLP
ncbi:hypothetical protein MIMGU_mgv11b024490mg [Erythranthe guttata]|uniref:Uncharacterized protein n=1 Tax=Erythranthe guttata TaxID=4155 RepID=A0A022QQF1_ERYGU|nr:hypothetical protein MIMGU_mgv11b024490mg [Erythranthe guttata]